MSRFVNIEEFLAALQNVGGGALTEDVISTIASGGTAAGTLFAQGLSLTEYVKLKETLNNLVITAPSYYITTNAGGKREVGSTFNLVRTFVFNRGEIKLNGVFQDYRAGAVTNYLIQGNAGATNARTVSGYVVVKGNNITTGTAFYAEGPQPLDVYGEEVGASLPAGDTGEQVSTFPGDYYNFFGVNTIATTSAQVRALNPTFASSFQLVIPAGQTEASFAYPAQRIDGTEWPDISESSVKYVEGFNSNQGGTFTKALFNVNDGGGVPVPYKIFTVTLPAIEAGNVTYNVTLP